MLPGFSKAPWPSSSLLKTNREQLPKTMVMAMTPNPIRSHLSCVAMCPLIAATI